VRDTLALMAELHRVAKAGRADDPAPALWSSDDAVEDPTHTRPYFEGSFVYFGQPAYSRADYGYRGDWAIESVKTGAAARARGEARRRAAPDDQGSAATWSKR